MTASQRPWSVPVRIDEIPEAGLRLDLEADAAARAAVAAAAGVDEVARLHAEFDLARHGRDGLRVVGSVSSTVRQTCVVTLDPVENEIDEAIDVLFAPPSTAPPSTAAAKGDAANLDVDAAEPPEVLIDGTVDLAAVATEFLILGIDPYPRKPGAVFEPPPSADAGSKPFAVLAALRTPRDRRRG
jgi:uncharacterized metal-binding protein YceD (DUF177 family)